MMKIICLLVLLMNYKIIAITSAGISSAAETTEEDFDIVIPDDIINAEGPSGYEISIVGDDGESTDIYVVNVGQKPQQLRTAKPSTNKTNFVKRNCNCIIQNRCAKSEACAKEDH